MRRESGNDEMRFVADRRLVVLLALAVVAVAPSALGLEVPYLSGRVNDQADLLDEGFERQLEDRLQTLESETGAQIRTRIMTALSPRLSTNT